MHSVKKFCILFILNQKLHVQLRNVPDHDCYGGGQQKEGNCKEKYFIESDNCETLTVQQYMWHKLHKNHHHDRKNNLYSRVRIVRKKVQKVRDEN